MVPRPRALLVSGLGLAVVGGMVYATLQTPPDMRRYTDEELVSVLVAEGAPLDWSAWACAAGEALMSDRPTYAALATGLAGFDDPRRRAVGAWLLGMQWSETQTEARRVAAQNMLVKLAADPDERVRCAACTSWFQRPTPPAARDVVEAVAGCLRSPDRKVREAALLAAIQVEDEAVVLRDALLARLRDERGDLARGLVVEALRKVRPVDPELQTLRRELLDDPLASVRRVAAAWFQAAPAGGSAAVHRLLAMARSAGDSREVRMQACSALARLVTEREHAEAVCGAILAEPPSESVEVPTWCLALGRLVSRMPGSPSLLRAADALRPFRANEDTRLGATAASVRIALANDGSIASTGDLAILRKAVVDWSSRLEQADESPMFDDGEDGAVEAMVELAARPGSGVDSREVQPLLSRVAGCRHYWLREWAQAQLQLLPP